MDCFDNNILGWGPGTVISQALGKLAMALDGSTRYQPYTTEMNERMLPSATEQELPL